MPQDIFAISHAGVHVLGGHALHGFEQQLFGQHQIWSVRLAEIAAGARADHRKALVGGDGPRVGGSCARGFAVILKDRWTRRRLESEIIHALPVAGQNAGGRVVMREHASVGAAPEKQATRFHFHQVRNIAKAFGSERFGITHAATECHDDHFTCRAGLLRGAIQPVRQNTVGDGKPRELNEPALAERKHQ